MQKDLETLTKLLSRLPGMGPRSAKRAILHMLKKPQSHMIPLAKELQRIADITQICPECGNIDTQSPCHICTSTDRQRQTICVVVSVDDLWAIERTHAYNGLYHVLAGTLSALEGVRPDDLNIVSLINRISNTQNNIEEVIMAMPATVDGQTTAHYVVGELDKIEHSAHITYLAHGVPIGGELDYIDDGTLTMALEKRQAIN